MKGLGKQSPELSEGIQRKIASIAEFAVKGRTHIHRNGYSKEIDYIPEAEAATRLAQQLAQLAKGSALIRGRTEVEQEDLSLVQRVAFDCIPAARRRLLDTLMRDEKPEASGLPSSSLSYIKEELQAVGLLTGEKLSEQAFELLVEAGAL